MTVVENQAAEGARVVAEDREYIIHSWSVQSALSPLAVAGAEGRYFWDYEGKRYLDFASQLVNVSIGHQHPKLVAAIKEQAKRHGDPFVARVGRDCRAREGDSIELVVTTRLLHFFDVDTGRAIRG